MPDKNNLTYALIILAILLVITTIIVRPDVLDSLSGKITYNVQPIEEKNAYEKQTNYNAQVENSIYEELEKNSKTRVIVKLKKSYSANTIKNNNLKIKTKIKNGFSAEVNKKELEELKKNPNIEKIYLDKKVIAFLNESVPLIEADKVHSTKVNGINLTGSGTSVCIIDTGIDYTHPALGGCFGSGCKVISGYDYVNNDTDPIDDNGHGSHCAGIVASENKTYQGVAPDANLIAIKALDNIGAGYTSNIIAGIEWCIDNSSLYNISVISMSLGSDCRSFPDSCYSDYCDDSETLYRDAINNAVAHNITVVIATGNEGKTNIISSPACIENATSVSATTKQDTILPLSNRAHILDLFAPGLNIVSTELAHTFVSHSGTSMAAPHVAGVAALIYQKNKLFGQSIKPDVIKKILKNTGVLIYDSGSSAFYPRINAYKAVNSVLKINQSDNSAENDAGKIKFKTQTDLSEVSAAFKISKNSIRLDSLNYPQFSKAAELNMYNLSFEKSPVIFKDGALCTSPLCNISNYTSNNLVFDVAGFTNYTAGANSNLTIWDSADSGMPYFISSLGINETAYFYANYTNITSGSAITTATCNISFDDGISSIMSYNGTKSLYEYSRNFTSSGLKNYNITCTDSNFENLSASDYITLLCSYPGPNINWIINESQEVVCDSKTILLNNSNMTISDNATLILKNSVLKLIKGASAHNLNVIGNSSLIVNDSWIGSNASGNFNLHIYSNADFNNLTTNGSQINFYSNPQKIKNSVINNNVYIRQDSSAIITNSTFNAQVEITNNKSNIINNSVFNSLVNIRLDSNNTIENSGFTNNLYLYDDSYNKISGTNISNLGMFVSASTTPVVNFTLPQSNITTNLLIGGAGLNATIYGYVDMPDSGTITSGHLTRYYPVHIHNQIGNPIANQYVEILNSTSQLWNGTTDSNGFVLANLVFNSTTDTYIYNITTNPSQNISMLEDTPINFTIIDSDNPVLDIQSPSNNSIENTSNTIEFIYNVTDNSSGISNCTLFINGIVNETDSSITETINQNFTKTLSNNYYNWSINCYDDAGNSAESGINYINITIRSVTILNLTSSPSWSQTEGTETNVSCSANNAEVSVNLYRTGASVTNPDIQNLPAGTYQYICNNSETQNWTSASEAKTLTINSKGGGSSGGGSRSSHVYCTELWECEEWSPCLSTGIKERRCNDVNKCQEKLLAKEITDIILSEKPETIIPCDNPRKLETESSNNEEHTLPKQKNNLSNQEQTQVQEYAPAITKPITNSCYVPVWLTLLIISLFSISAYSFNKYYDIFYSKEKITKLFPAIKLVSYSLFLFFSFITFFLCPEPAVIITFSTIIVTSIVLISFVIHFRRVKKN